MPEPDDSDSSQGAGAPVESARLAAPRPRRNALGEERPAFMLEFPRDPELEALMQAFELGDFARVRAEAEPLAQRTTDEAVRRAARELRRRIDPDPLLLLLLGLSIALFVFIAVWVYAR
jgi:hypothetical protein